MDARAPLCLVACGDALETTVGVARALGAAVTPSRDVWFSCGEAKHVIDANVRGTDVYIFQHCYVPSGTRSMYDRLMMVLHAVDAARMADADRVTVVLPYFPGARQDKRKGRTREGVSTGLIARMLQSAGASMVLTVEPHNEAMVGCFDPRVCVFEIVHITGAFTKFLVDNGLVGDVVTSTDAGGLQIARRFASTMSCGLVALAKERDYSKSSTVTATTVIGDVDGRNVLVVDDLIDTGGSVVSAVQALWHAGARDVTVAAAHTLMSGQAWRRFDDLHKQAIDRGVRFAVAGTSSVPHANPPEWYHNFSLVPLLSRVVRSVNRRGSVSEAVEEPPDGV